ncbi:MAG: LysE family translocator [Betaproteobacteria bacterium]
MNPSEFWALIALATAMSFSPGPNTTLSTTLAANLGLRRALPFVCSVPVGWSLLLSACALGLGTLILAAPWLVWVVKAAGVGYLLWLALKLARSRGLGQAGDRLQVGFFQGIGLQFVNIKAWMLALTVVSGWVAGQGPVLTRLLQVVPVMMFFAFCSNLTYALVGSLLRQWLAGPDGSGLRLLRFNRLMAGVLTFTGLWILLR